MSFLRMESPNGSQAVQPRLSLEARDSVSSPSAELTPHGELSSTSYSLFRGEAAARFYTEQHPCCAGIDPSARLLCLPELDQDGEVTQHRKTRATRASRLIPAPLPGDAREENGPIRSTWIRTGSLFQVSKTTHESPLTFSSRSQNNS